MGLLKFTKREKFSKSEVSLACQTVCVGAANTNRLARETSQKWAQKIGPTRYTNYPGLTRIGSREKRNCSFDDVEIINAIT